MRDGRDLSVIFERPTMRDTFRISYLANRLVLPAYNDIKRVYGLSRGEYLLLFCLSYIEELTAQDVAEMTGRPRNSISRAVHRMLDEGYLKRSPDPT
ncbi:MAG: helix-turn-helix domain-containing protein, partial [Pseudomonadota bacterium]|nr:helix-turn-helix domain-containing protein [Pseudomonadota bacterium]